LPRFQRKHEVWLKEVFIYDAMSPGSLQPGDGLGIPCKVEYTLGVTENGHEHLSVRTSDCSRYRHSKITGLQLTLAPSLIKILRIGFCTREGDGMKGSISLVAILLSICLATARADGAMQDDIDQAAAILERFQSIPESAIPFMVMREARGLAILNVTKAGFIGSGSYGNGIVVARTDKGWSAPSAIGTGAMGFGFQAGIQVSELVIVLNTPSAVAAFAQGGNFTLGGNLSVAAGPVGRETGGSFALGAVMYTYSRTQGLFAGVSVDGTVVFARNGANEEYYGKPVTPRELLSGEIPPPPGTKRLIEVLSKE
jgi:lipid-binding SYLF domain-containing protein